MYETQLQNNMARLTSLLYELYGKRWDFYKVLNELEKFMHKAYEERNSSLKKNDENFLNTPVEKRWYLKSDAVGMMLYVDLFSGDLKKLLTKIDYFKESGINYIHLMPLIARKMITTAVMQYQVIVKFRKIWELLKT